jgi:hypothetical protein
MATLQTSSNDRKSDLTAKSEAEFLDMATIRRRLAKIKNCWSAETARARAIEGARRRAQLETLVADFSGEADDNACEDHGFSLVG